MSDASKPGRAPLKSVVRGLKRFGRNDLVVLSSLALVVGAAGGGAAIVFRLGIDFFQQIFFGVNPAYLTRLAAELPVWRLLLVPTLGGLAIGLFVYHLMPGRRPRGVAQVIEASALRGGRMSLTNGLMAAFVSASSIGVGASVGREGPVVHLGACLGGWLARRLQLGRVLSRTLLGCGVAAAVAASFNAPIAGVFFALEVVIGHYALSAFAPIVIAGVTGTIVSRMYFGDFPAFILQETQEIASFLEFPAFALLGVISAVVAIVLMRAVMLTEDIWSRVPVPSWTRPAFAGLALGLVALGFPQVLGVGYETTDAALSEHLDLQILIALIVVKVAATAICLGSGFGGGIFSPSLFVGAVLGGAFGIVATSVFPQLSSGHAAYTVVGMGAVAGAVLGAPISTILIVFEMTGDYTLTVAVMIATVIASVITQQVHGRSFFVWQLERSGVTIKGGQEISLLRTITVDGFTDRRFETIEAQAPLALVRERLPKAPWGELFVIDAENRLVGTITFSDLADAAFDTSRDEALVALDVARQHPTVLQVGEDLEAAIKVYGASGEVHVPVVDSLEEMRLLGVVHEHEVMLAYHRALQQARAEERGEL
ncbi:MAG: chloride channel protein [Kiloniellales bacterium]|nr:chloride channel protein [Kiloniellales bacterium]MDJ0982119.1 chloride channel protein [Kiloniellales bacterium]